MPKIGRQLRQQLFGRLRRRDTRRSPDERLRSVEYRGCEAGIARWPLAESQRIVESDKIVCSHACSPNECLCA